MITDKITKSAKVVDKILKIVQGFLIAFIIVSLIFIPLTLILGERIVVDGEQSLKIGVLSFAFSGDLKNFIDFGQFKLSIILMLVTSAVACGAGWFCLRVLRSVLAPMKEGEPFARGIASKIRTLGWTSLIGGGLIEIGRTLVEVFELNSYDLDALFVHGPITGVEARFTIDLWFVVLALVLFFLSYVFRCGEDLQREVDELL